MSARGVVTLAVALALAGCGGAEPRADETPAPAPAPTFPAEPIAPLAVDAPAGGTTPIAPPETVSATAPVATSVRLVYATVAEGPLAKAQILSVLRVEVVAPPSGETIPDAAGPIGRSFELLEGTTPVVLANGSIVTLGGSVVLDGASDPVSSFARGRSGEVSVVKGRSLGALAEGVFAGIIELPSVGFSVVAGDDGSLYLFRRDDERGAIYVVKDLRAAKLVDAPARVSAVAASGRRIFFALEHVIYTVAPGDPASIIFDVPSFKARSLAYDAARSLLYASDGTSVLAISNGTAFPIATGLGGELRLVSGGAEPGLYVLDPERRALVRLTNLDALALR